MSQQQSESFDSSEGAHEATTEQAQAPAVLVPVPIQLDGAQAVLVPIDPDEVQDYVETPLNVPSSPLQQQLPIPSIPTPAVAATKQTPPRFQILSNRTQAAVEWINRPDWAMKSKTNPTQAREDQIAASQVPRQDTILGMVGTTPIVNFGGSTDVRKKVGRFSLLQAPVPAKGGGKAKGAAVPKLPPVVLLPVSATGDDMVVAPDLGSVLPAAILPTKDFLSNSSGVKTASSSSSQSTSLEPKLSDTGDVAVSYLKDSVSIPNLKQQVQMKAGLPTVSAANVTPTYHFQTKRSKSKDSRASAPSAFVVSSSASPWLGKLSKTLEKVKSEMAGVDKEMRKLQGEIKSLVSTNNYHWVLSVGVLLVVTAGLIFKAVLFDELLMMKNVNITILLRCIQNEQNKVLEEKNRSLAMELKEEKVLRIAAQTKLETVKDQCKSESSSSKDFTGGNEKFSEAVKEVKAAAAGGGCGNSKKWKRANSMP